MAPVFFGSLASEEEHDEDDDDKDDDSDEEEDVGRGVGSGGCSPWRPMDVGGRGTSGSGGPSISPVDQHKEKSVVDEGRFAAIGDL